eukprot:15132790-Heterocapsa_arctica.AAC.1
MARQGYESWSCGYNAGAGQTQFGVKRTTDKMNFVPHDANLLVHDMNGPFKDEKKSSAEHDAGHAT